MELPGTLSYGNDLEGEISYMETCGSREEKPKRKVFEKSFSL